MNILLMMASHFRDDGSVHRVSRYWTSAVTLPYLAALTPPGHRVDLLDEMMHEVDLDGDYDLVGISAMGLQIGRAYWLADEFRRRGKTVAMGGEWVSLVPEQALEHCDAVVVGDAEYTWPELVRDCEARRLRRVYQAERLHDWKGLPKVDLKRLPLFRPELMRERIYRDYYFQFPLLVTRGCPKRCDYCSVTQFHGATYRKRPIPEILEDIESIKAMGSGSILFMDDNPVADREYAKELFRQMIPLRVRWCSQCTIEIAQDPELLRLAADSGCFLLSIGFESLDQHNLDALNKRWARAGRYAELIRRIREHGIQIVALVMLGLDQDDETAFDRTLEFLIRNKVALAKFHLPLPYPGTRFFEAMERQGRILTRDWNDYHYGRAVIRPARMSPEVAERKFWETYDRFFSMTSILRRFVPPPRRRLKITSHYFLANLAFRALRGGQRHPYLF